MGVVGWRGVEGRGRVAVLPASFAPGWPCDPVPASRMKESLPGGAWEGFALLQRAGALGTGGTEGRAGLLLVPLP